MMVGVTVDIDAVALAKLQRLLQEVNRVAPRRLQTETRRAALYICQGLKKRTKQAPKRIPRKEWEAIPSPVPPRYIHSNSSGKPLLRRWMLTRKLGTPDAYSKHYYVYTKAKLGKNGKMVGKNPTEEKRELLQQHGGISRRGLAKKSWGWVAKGIYAAGGEADLTLAWRGHKRDRRDPRQYVKGEFQKVPDGAFARILNRLDYIRAALKPGAISETITAATKRLNYNIADVFDDAPHANEFAAIRAWRKYAKAKGRI
jgi:hypothetical protein